MGSSAQLLPPKMAAQFAGRAKKGEANISTGNTYTFYQGHQEVVLVSLDPPSGYVRKLSGAEFAALDLKK